MARKVVAQQPQRRTGVNRAQLKALAARQAMTAAAVSSAQRPAMPEGEEPAAAGLDYAELLPRAQRRVTLSREQEYSYIRGDLIRLSVIAVGLLALLLALLVILR